MGTKNNPGKFDCYANAEPDEPMFVLLGRDKHAPTLVWLWAVLREMDQENAEKVHEARECMGEMIRWQHDKGKKPVGISQAVVAGVFELMRAANHSFKLLQQRPLNIPITVEEMRVLMSATMLGDDDANNGEEQ